MLTKMYQASLVLSSLPAFCGTERIFVRVLYQSTGEESLVKEAKVIHADNCKHRQAPAYTESSE